MGAAEWRPRRQLGVCFRTVGRVGCHKGSPAPPPGGGKNDDFFLGLSGGRYSDDYRNYFEPGPALTEFSPYLAWKKWLFKKKNSLDKVKPNVIS